MDVQLDSRFIVVCSNLSGWIDLLGDGRLPTNY